ncbi:MAG: peptidase Ste24p [Moraxellaceae bacterium]|jgi:predicted Zn-dependent protease|nr:peptidase Ste24p [Moraxellaceae bacterium]
MKRLLLATLVLASTAHAFDLGNALQKLGDPETQKALGIGKKMIKSLKDIPEPQEIEIGQGITANLLGAAPLVKDEALQQYVNKVGLWIALQSERPGLPWRFGVTEDADVNAFATPGGTILITRGLYEKLRNEAELAGVLAHEISHVVQRHQLKAIKSALGREWQMELATAVAEKKNNRDAAHSLQAFTAGTELFARGLDKGDEFEADRMGVVLVARAGYNPFGLVASLQTLDAVNPQDGAVALMFKTHPSPAKRLEMLAQTMGAQLDRYAESGREPARLRTLKTTAQK